MHKLLKSFGHKMNMLKIYCKKYILIKANKLKNQRQYITNLHFGIFFSTVQLNFDSA